MNRRTFLKSGSAAGAAALAGMRLAAQPNVDSAPARGFKLKYAPHFGMFKEHAGADLPDQLRFAADQGFTAWEDNELKKRPVELQEKIGATMERLGMTMGVFVATADFENATFASSDPAAREKFLADIHASIDVARRVRATWMTIVPGCYDLKLAWDFQTANVIDNLRRCCEILEPHGLVMVMEPLNTLRNHPGVFLSKIPQAYMIARAVDSSSCKILFDMYHQQITEGNIIPNIDAAWDGVAYFQIGDNPGRKEPGTGEMNYRNILRHIHRKGFTGVLGMEHGNSQPGKAGELAVINAYRQVDDFEIAPA